jgi:hypothetical protein
VGEVRKLISLITSLELLYTKLELTENVLAAILPMRIRGGLIRVRTELNSKEEGTMLVSAIHNIIMVCWDAAADALNVLGPDAVSLIGAAWEAISTTLLPVDNPPEFVSLNSTHAGVSEGGITVDVLVRLPVDHTLQISSMLLSRVGVRLGAVIVVEETEECNSL